MADVFGDSDVENESQSHDILSDLEVEEQESQTSDSEEDEETNPDRLLDWNLTFKDDAIEFMAETHVASSQLGLNELSSPLEVLQVFVTETMVETICEESTRYAAQKPIKNYKPLQEADFWRFFAVNLAMGITKKPKINDYWSTNLLMSAPFFGKTMTRDRYWDILRSLHFVDNSTVPANEKNRFVKLGSFMSDLLENFRRAIHPGEYLCLDESMVPFKGRLSIKQYMPKKRTRFGIKLFILADCASRMILDVLPYQGKSTELKNPEQVKNLGFGGASVLTLLDRYLDKGHRVVVDNYFNSPGLANNLKNRKTYVLGTVQKRRQGMPKGNRMTRKLKKGEVEVFSNGETLVERWNDRREVFMLNTFIPHSMQDSESENPANRRLKPGSVIIYNTKMGTVDDADKIMKPYKNTRKSFKWYRKVAFHMFDLAVYNSYQLYNQLTQRKIPYLKFLQDLISNILEKYPKEEIKRGRPTATISTEMRLTGSHFPQKLFKLGENSENKKPARFDCAYCKATTGKRKSTSFGCSTCSTKLCIAGPESCFYLFHTVKKIKKQRIEPIQPQESDSFFENSQDFDF